MGKRKRHRLQPAQEAESQSSDEDSAQKEFDAEAGFSASHWRIVNSYAKVALARWFSLPDETYVNKILVKALGADILVTANHLPYDVGYEKIRTWGSSGSVTS